MYVLLSTDHAMCLYKGMLGINLILSIEIFGRIEIDLNLTDKKNY